MKKLIFAIFISIIVSAVVFPQGKIISKETAADIFGQVLVSKEMPSADLMSLTKQSTKLIMFKFLGNDVYILGDNRKVLLPAGKTVNESDEFFIYSTEIVQELLTKGNEKRTFIEQRKDVLTITNGNFTLEYSLICPPFCF